MAKKPAPKRQAQSSQNIDLFALLLALMYFQSVLTVAHHTSLWLHNGTTHIVESPGVTFLLISLILCIYSWHKRFRPSTLVIITLTILVISSIFWLSGLRTNFYF